MDQWGGVGWGVGPAASSLLAGGRALKRKFTIIVNNLRRLAYRENRYICLFWRTAIGTMALFVEYVYGEQLDLKNSYREKSRIWEYI